MRKIFYFCTVKTVVRHMAAALKQRFLLPNLIGNLDIERIKECGSSNARKVIAQQYLTTPCALFCLTSKKVVL